MCILNRTVGLLMAIVLGVDPVFAAGSISTSASNLPNTIGIQGLYQSQAVNPALVQGFDARQDPAGRAIASRLRRAEGTETGGDDSLTLPSTPRAERVLFYL